MPGIAMALQNLRTPLGQVGQPATAISQDACREHEHILRHESQLDVLPFIADRGEDAHDVVQALQRSG